jgi:hypothetical protein
VELPEGVAAGDLFYERAAIRFISLFPAVERHETAHRARFAGNQVNYIVSEEILIDILVPGPGHLFRCETDRSTAPRVSFKAKKKVQFQTKM